ncbi:protein required for cell viability [Penicillium citrinum]|uniref:Protein required for cell viability n=1 Tax=Penicillium citrinum TaxID=5077 RepID=A0A9W9PE65_PENCI|nr:protein required for cell viability [Penicillium citrinum]KAJ5241663.1 protein required for cell viability [Penicillium citrinum]
MITVAGRRQDLNRKRSENHSLRRKRRREREERKQREPAMPEGGSSPRDLQTQIRMQKMRTPIWNSQKKAADAANIVAAWAAGASSDDEPDDLRVRASALPILASAAQVNILGLGPGILSQAVDLALKTLTLEQSLKVPFSGVPAWSSSSISSKHSRRPVNQDEAKTLDLGSFNGYLYRLRCAKC